MVTATRSARTPVRTIAQHEFLCTQRRLCVVKGFHRFTLRFNGKTNADEAAAFFKKCPELDCMIQSDGKHQWIVNLSRR